MTFFFIMIFLLGICLRFQAVLLKTEHADLKSLKKKGEINNFFSRSYKKQREILYFPPEIPLQAFCESSQCSVDQQVILAAKNYVHLLCAEHHMKKYLWASLTVRH